MNFDKLIEPYKEDGRTVQGQIKWLQSKGIPQDKIDQAILHVYDEIERGKIHEHGHALDRYLLEVAQGFHHEELDAHAKRLENFFNAFKDRWREELEAQKSPPTRMTLWQRIKAVFTG